MELLCGKRSAVRIRGLHGEYNRVMRLGQVVPRLDKPGSTHHRIPLTLALSNTPNGHATGMYAPHQSDDKIDEG
jgi:hypothetical protein